MPKFCPKCVEIVVCDFCKFYKFSSDGERIYRGEGCCLLHFLPEDPDGGCDDFECYMLGK